MKAWFERLLNRDPTVLRSAHWLVVDCETSGLDARTDRLLSIGAVKAHGGRIALQPVFNRVLRQESVSERANILVHGLGGQAQLAGGEPRDILQEFLAYANGGLPVAFHAPFDAAVLGRALRAHELDPLGIWLDCAQLAPALFPRLRPAHGQSRSLDDWLAALGIECALRHDALADAYATAQLLLVLLSEAGRQGARTVADLRRIEGAGRWRSAQY